MKNQLIFFLLICSLPLFSQKTTLDRPDLILEPNPFKKEYFKDHYDYSKFKEMVVLNTKGFKLDTLSKNTYDKEGKISQKIRYSNNVAKIFTHYAYIDNDLLKNWVYTSRGTNIRAIYSYDKEGKILKIQQYDLRLRNGIKDSSLKSTSEFEYENSRLKTIKSNKGLIENYIYEKDRLVYKTGGYISKAFVYNDVGNLIELTEYMGGIIDKSKLMGSKKFYYNKRNLLICDSILTSANFETKTYQITHYEYDEKDRLKKFKVEFGSSFSEVNFEYENNRIFNCFVKTNDVNYKVAYLRFPMPSGIVPNSSGIVNYRDEFRYDSNGNKISKKVFVEGDLFFEVRFILNSN